MATLSDQAARRAAQEFLRSIPVRQVAGVLKARQLKQWLEIRRLDMELLESLSQSRMIR